MMARRSLVAHRLAEPTGADAAEALSWTNSAVQAASTPGRDSAAVAGDAERNVARILDGSAGPRAAARGCCRPPAGPMVARRASGPRAGHGSRRTSRAGEALIDAIPDQRRGRCAVRVSTRRARREGAATDPVSGGWADAAWRVAEPLQDRLGWRPPHAPAWPASGPRRRGLLRDRWSGRSWGCRAVRFGRVPATPGPAGVGPSRRSSTASLLFGTGLHGRGGRPCPAGPRDRKSSPARSSPFRLPSGLRRRFRRQIRYLGPCWPCSLTWTC
jgi:hypothetical protein